MTPQLAPDIPENIVSIRDGIVAVVLMPFAPELTASEKNTIDAAQRIRFFIFGCSSAPVPAGHSGHGTLIDYPLRSVQWAFTKATYICAASLGTGKSPATPQTLADRLLELDARAGKDDHRCVVTFVTDRPFEGDDVALYRPRDPVRPRAPSKQAIHKETPAQ